MRNLKDMQEGLALVQKARNAAVPLYQTTFLHFELGRGQVLQSGLLACVWMDAQHRPHLADLWRVHAAKGAGDVMTQWVYDVIAPIPTFYLLCTFFTPVHLTFALSFPLDQYADTLETLAECSMLTLMAHRPPPRFQQRASSPVVTCSSAELAPLLAHGCIIEADHPEMGQVIAGWKSGKAALLN